jgi:hypothetical protein
VCLGGVDCAAGRRGSVVVPTARAPTRGAAAARGAAAVRLAVVPVRAAARGPAVAEGAVALLGGAAARLAARERVAAGALVTACGTEPSGCLRCLPPLMTAPPDGNVGSCGGEVFGVTPVFPSVVGQPGTGSTCFEGSRAGGASKPAARHVDASWVLTPWSTHVMLGRRMGSEPLHESRGYAETPIGAC